MSPSVSDTAFSRGDYETLPTTDAHLETLYTEGDEADVATSNDVRVSQTSTNQQYAIHQFKHNVGVKDLITFVWEGQTNYPPSILPVYMQLYNQTTDQWDTISSDNTSNTYTDFVLSVSNYDVADYKDASNIITWRVYQQHSFTTGG